MNLGEAFGCEEGMCLGMVRRKADHCQFPYLECQDLAAHYGVVDEQSCSHVDPVGTWVVGQTFSLEELQGQQVEMLEYD
jgi:hypothetical protein